MGMGCRDCFDFPADVPLVFPRHSQKEVLFVFEMVAEGTAGDAGPVDDGFGGGH
jgi:hypothetical protein